MFCYNYSKYGENKISTNTNRISSFFAQPTQSLSAMADTTKKAVKKATSDNVETDSETIPLNGLKGENSGVLRPIVQNSSRKEIAGRKQELIQKRKNEDLTPEEENELKQLQTMLRDVKRAKKTSQNERPQEELSQNRKILSDILTTLQYFGTDSLIKGAISQFQDARVSSINFFNKQYQGKDFDKAFSNELKAIFSSAFKNTDLDTDSTKWAEFFKSKLKEIDTKPSTPKNAVEDAKTNEENNQNFAYNLKLLILAKKLSQLAKVSNDNRFFYFDPNAAQRTFDMCNDLMNSQNNQDIEQVIDTFIQNYKANLRTALFEDCTQFEITDETGKSVGKVYDIEQFNGDQAHDDLQVRRLQNIAGERWCTCHAESCCTYLEYAKSFLFIPNEGNRIMRIQTRVNGNNFVVTSVTGLENDHNASLDCWISTDEDIEHFLNFMSTMKDKNYNISLGNIFNIGKISEDAKTKINTYFRNIFNGYNSKINELMQNPSQHADEIRNVLNGLKKIKNDVLDEDSIIIKNEIIKKCLELLSGRFPRFVINFSDIDELNSPNIQEIRSLDLYHFNNINLPKLEKADYIRFQGFNGEKIEFPELQEARTLMFEDTASTTINLPNLEKIADKTPNGIELSSFKSFSIPKLQELPNLSLNIKSVDDIGDFEINPNLHIDTLEIQSVALFYPPFNSEIDIQSFLKNTLSGNKELLTKLKEIFKHADKVIILDNVTKKESDKLVLTKDKVQEILKEAGIE